MDAFFNHIQLEQIRINKILSKNKKMIPLTESQLKKFEECQICPSCDTTLTKENKIKHLCHVTGNYISPLCNNCNLQMKFRKRFSGRKERRQVLLDSHRIS